MVTEEKGKKQKLFLFLVLSPRPGPDGSNASGWYRRLREPISPLSLLKCDQLWQLFSRGWTILLSTVIYDLDSRIAAKYSKYQTSFYSMQVSFRFHSLRFWDTCISEYLHTDLNLEVSLNRGGFEKFFRKLTHHPYLDGHLSQSGTRYRPQLYKVGLCPSPHPGTIAMKT